MRLSRLTVEDLRAVVADAVEAKLREMLGDADAAPRLRPNVAARLRASLRRARKGERGVPARTIARSLGLRW